jgi:chromosome segregation ATPase
MALNALRKEALMDEKEKYRTRIDIRLTGFDETINEIKNKLERRKENMPEIQIEKLRQKHEEAKTKLASLEKSDTDAWHKYKAELDDLVDDIDDDLRSALAYFA